MTSTVQLMQTPLQEQWKSLFPNCTTLTGSINFMKKLMAVSLSTITYVRGIFPDRAYGERQLSGLKLKLLSENSGIVGVDKFINLIKSCYGAIDKGYLYQISVGICTDIENRDEVLEAYHLNFRYNDGKRSDEKSSSSITLSENEPIVDSTLALLQSIHLTSDILHPLPPNAYLTMKLLYNDEITPMSYEPAGFESSVREKFIFPENAVKLAIGKVNTNSHEYRLYVKTALSKQPLKQMLEESVLTDSQRSDVNIDHPMEEDVLPQSQMDSDIIENTLPEAKIVPEKINCPCTCEQDSGTDILRCSICESSQHSICYGILHTEGYEFEFYCIQCINEAPTRQMLQDLIYSLDGKEQQQLCALRRALVFCSAIKHVTVLQLEKGLKCSKKLAIDVIEKLEFDGFVRKSGQKYIVNENKIKNFGYQDYFPPQLNKENVKNSSQMKNPKEKKSYDVAELDDLGGTSQKSNFKKKVHPVSSNQCMDFDKVSGLIENQAVRKSKRKLKIANDDSEDQPAKRRCIEVKSPITLV